MHSKRKEKDSNCFHLARKLSLRQLDPPCVCLASQPAFRAGHNIPLRNSNNGGAGAVVGQRKIDMKPRVTETFRGGAWGGGGYKQNKATSIKPGHLSSGANKQSQKELELLCREARLKVPTPERVQRPRRKKMVHHGLKLCPLRHRVIKAVGASQLIWTCLS